MAALTMTTPLSTTLSLNEIAERLQGYDPQALSARHVNDFLAQLVQPVQTPRFLDQLEKLTLALSYLSVHKL